VLICRCLSEGISAQEIHLCGEESGIDFIRHVAMITGDDMEVRKYKRLTSLTVLDKAIGEILTLLPTPSMSVGMGRIFESVCLSVCPQHNSKMNDPKVFKLGIGIILGYPRSGTVLGFNKCIFHTNVRSITQKLMIQKCLNLIYGMILGYPASDMVLG